jgi:hypothetical protein
MRALHDPGSSNERLLAELIAAHRHNRPDFVAIKSALHGVITNMMAEIDAGFVGSLQAQIAGEVLHDLVKLAKEVLVEDGDGAKNVACVLPRRRLRTPFAGLQQLILSRIMRSSPT